MRMENGEQRRKPGPSAAATFPLILAPMWLTFAGFRIYLHFIDHNTDLIVAGHEVHHLFSGALLALAAAFVIAFDFPARWLRVAGRVALGIGAGLTLDEVVYLIATDGTNASYLLPVSLWGGLALMALATAGLAVCWLWARRGRGAP